MYLSVLIQLGLTASVWTPDGAIHKKMFGSGTRPLNLAKELTLIIPNEEMNGIKKIVKLLKESVLLIKSVSEAIKNEGNE